MADLSQDPIARLNAALEGRYRVEREIGEGGMATVYLAEDLRHERNVALKVLKPELAAVVGAERFLAEIKTTANLQHPHILPLHDSGEADEFLFFVAPYIEGDTLRDKIDREKQLSVEEALDITKKVASALDYAHELGVVHRDIKPGNILLSERGEPSVADFGIALAVAQAGGGRVTETGLSVGTPHYMSPEQATGERDVDPRTDLYALGCVLYEMLTGEPPFSGANAQAVLAKILTDPSPAPTKVRISIPRNVDAAIRKALEKLPADRFGSAQKFANALSNPGYRHGGEAQGAPAAWGGLRAWQTAAVAVLALLVGAAGAMLWPGTRNSAAPGVAARLRTELPPEIDFRTVAGIRLSPDGRYAAVVGSGSGTRVLWLWPLGSLNATLLPGTEGALSPFWSPDNGSIAFVVDGSLRRVEIAGGPAQTIVGEGVRAGGGASGDWNEDGVILFAHVAGGIWRVPATGGDPVPVVTTLGHLDLPVYLPDGTNFLYLDHMGPDPATHGVYLGSIDLAPEEQSNELIVAAEDGPVYLRGSRRGRGQIVVWREGSLLAQPFDERALEPIGSATPVAANVGAGGGNGTFSASSHGEVLMYPSAEWVSDAEGLRFVWVARGGGEESLPLPAGEYGYPRVSPDGRRIATSIQREDREDLWVFDAATGAGLQLTEAGEGEFNRVPMWAPDGQTIYFSSTKDVPAPESWTGTWWGNVYGVPADGSAAPARMMTTEENQAITSIAPDGGTLVYTRVVDPATRWEVMTVPVDGSSEPVPRVSGTSRRGTGTISPDGRWLAYRSDETGTWEIYVQPFPGPGARVPVSIDGGLQPVWSQDGRELYYRRGDQMMMAATIEGDVVPEVTERNELFSALGYVFGTTSPRWYHVAPDGRFLMLGLPGRPVNTDGGGSESPLVVLLNQFEEDGE